MKNLVLIIGIVLAANYFLSGSKPDFSILPELPAVAAGNRIEIFEIGKLYDNQTTLKNLAQPGAYTVVEIYSDHCRKCKKIESKFPDFVDRREDVVIKRVRTFSGSISFSSKEEQNVWLNRQKAITSFYHLRGTPHIEIYDSNGNAIAKDKGGNKSGLKFLEQWLEIDS